MKKWSQYLAIPATLAILAGCQDNGAIDTDSTADQTEQVEETDQQTDEQVNDDSTINDDTTNAGADDIDLSTVEDGTYEGIGHGRNGEIAVTVEVSNNEITDITVDHEETPEYIDEGLDDYLEAIKAEGSTNVDQISGATMTSGAIKEALFNALGQELASADADSGASEDGEEGGWASTTSDYDVSPEEALEREDLSASGEAAKGSTIADVDKSDDEWVEKAAEATNAVEGDTYVKLDRGVLTVDQIDHFLKTMPIELTYADDNNQFLYYNNHIEDPTEMLGTRLPGQAGDPLEAVHPEGTYANVAWVINQLREKHTDNIRMAVPSGGPGQFVVHDYYGIYDDEGNYMGINELIHDIFPHVEFFLKETGYKLVDEDGNEIDFKNLDKETDSDSSATE